MNPVSETIDIQSGTFGTTLELMLFSGENMKNLSVSSYDRAIIRAYSITDGKERFHGNINETLSAVTNNILNYTFIEDDTSKKGVYNLKLELLNLTGDTITYKEIINIANLRIL